MLRVIRHCVAALLAVTLATQLIEAQVLACVGMGVTGGASMEAMPGMVHDAHDRSSSGTAASSQEANDEGPSKECPLQASCVNSSADPVVASYMNAVPPAGATVAGRTHDISSRSLRPDLPPPRI